MNRSFPLLPKMMMRKLYTTLLLTIFVLTLNAQNKINQYEYWFDGDYATKVTTAVTPVANYHLNTQVGTASLNIGLHIINFRFRDDSLKYSPVVSQFFYKMQNSSGPTLLILKGEYWLDEDYAGKVVVNFSGSNASEHLLGNISTTSVGQGLHRFQIRFFDSSGKWSSVMSQFFYKQNTSLSGLTAYLSNYEYWYDSDVANKVTGTFSGTATQENLLSTVTTTALLDGLHTFNIRFKDNFGKWSSVASQFFYRNTSLSGSTAYLSSYEYWYDNDYAGKVTSSFSGTTTQEHVLSTIATTSLNDGLHTFNIRFKDSFKNWSSVVSQFFYRQTDAAGSTALLTDYEYWFDNDDANKVAVAFSGSNAQEHVSGTINTNAVNTGLHTFQIRFKDNHNKWSGVISQFFYKMPPAVATNLITAYRYWLDDNYSAMQTIRPAVAVPQLNLIENLDLTQVWKGQHYLHFQFKDTLDMWSVVTTDTIVKEALPVAAFVVNDSTICLGDTIALTSYSVDGDTHSWSFGDGNVSTDSVTSHVYSTAGVYTLSLTVNDTASGRDSTIVQHIHVSAYPLANINIIGNDTLCAGESVQLNGLAVGANYVWNTSEVSSSIIVSTQGLYYAQISSTDNPSCAVTSDSVEVIVNPLPVVNFGNDTAICAGDSIVLDASNAGATYLWNTGAQTSSIGASQTNQYNVVVTNAYGCVQSDTINLTVNPLPVAGFTYSVVDSTATFSNNAQYATTFSWNFGDGNFSNAPNPIHTFPAGGGTFTIQLAVTNGCGTDVSTQVITITPIGIDEKNAQAFGVSLFPNPTSDRVNINVNMEEANRLSIDVYDYTGKHLERIIDENRPGGFQYIWYSTQNLSSGMYYIEIQSGDKRMTKKLIVNK